MAAIQTTFFASLLKAQNSTGHERVIAEVRAIYSATLRIVLLDADTKTDNMLKFDHDAHHRCIRDENHVLRASKL